MMKKTLVHILSLLFCLAFTACQEDEGPDTFEPALSIGGAEEVTRTSATISAGIALRGNTAMPELQFLYGDSENTNEESKPLSTKDGKVSLQLTGLKPGTTYYYKLKASSGRVTLYSDMAQFTTLPNNRPTVGDAQLLSQGPLSAILSFEILANGGEPIKSCGLYLTEVSTGKKIKIEQDKNLLKETVHKLRVGSLTENTTYEIVPFAVNNIGETAGKGLTLTTTGGVLLSYPGELALLLGNERFAIASLSIGGKLDGDDIRCLREMMGAGNGAVKGCLSRLNIADAEIVEGGGPFDGEHFSESNVISQRMFADCSLLQEIVLPDAASALRKDALANCTALTCITVPAGVAEILPSEGCAALERIEVSAANSHYKSIDGVLFDKAAAHLLRFPYAKTGHYELPSTVTELGDYAFQSCRLTSITLPDGLASMGIAVFKDCLFEKIIMPAMLRTVPKAAFQNCALLKEVHLGEMTENVGSYAFDGCPLENLHIKAEVPPVCSDNAFGANNSSIYSSCTLHVPEQSLESYCYHQQWGKFERIVKREE